jgi:putative ABC transport system substrate-binding protein
MRRREFLGAVAGSAAAAWPLAVLAQQADRVHRVGIIFSETPAMAVALPAFRAELRKLGYIETQNLAIDQRLVHRDGTRLFADAVELARQRVDVIVAGTTVAIDAAIAASSAIPIVMWANNFDPFAHGYVKTLARPGGRITGVFNRQPELAEKQVELLRDAFPAGKRLGVLWDDVSADQFTAAERRARALQFEVQSIRFERLPYDIRAAFRTLAEGSAQMLLVLSTPFVALYQRDIVQATVEHKLPAMFIFRTYAEDGGLMSYGIHIDASFRRVAHFVAKILNGANPADLPVEQPTLYQLVVNLKTAKAIGVELPTSILLRADEVIE